MCAAQTLAVAIVDRITAFLRDKHNASVTEHVLMLSIIASLVATVAIAFGGGFYAAIHNAELLIRTYAGRP